jgi:hypothetical protein
VPCRLDSPGALNDERRNGPDVFCRRTAMVCTDDCGLDSGPIYSKLLTRTCMQPIQSRPVERPDWPVHAPMSHAANQQRGGTAPAVLAGEIRMLALWCMLKQLICEPTPALSPDSTHPLLPTQPGESLVSAPCRPGCKFPGRHACCDRSWQAHGQQGPDWLPPWPDWTGSVRVHCPAWS